MTKEVATESKSSSKAHASPSIRRFARELGVNLDLITGSGPKHRILKEDVQAYVKTELSKQIFGSKDTAAAQQNATENTKQKATETLKNTLGGLLKKKKPAQDSAKTQSP